MNNISVGQLSIEQVNKPIGQFVLLEQKKNHKGKYTERFGFKKYNVQFNKKAKSNKYLKNYNKF